MLSERPSTLLETGETGETCELAGVAFHALTPQDTVGVVVSELAAGRGGWICPVNLDVLRRITASATLRQLVGEADLLVADGMPLLWANRLAGGRRLPARVAGSTLVSQLAGACALSGHSVFLLGGNPGTAQRAGVQLQESHPGLRVAGTLCPPLGFEHDPAMVAEIEAELLRVQPDLVCVALGFPKQDRLALQLRATLPQSWFLSCGIALSFLTGEVPRAPRLLQIFGLEWLHRLAQEPRRLARRYLIEGPPFLLRLIVWALLRRSRRALVGLIRRKRAG